MNIQCCLSPSSDSENTGFISAIQGHINDKIIVWREGPICLVRRLEEELRLQALFSYLLQMGAELRSALHKADWQGDEWLAAGRECGLPLFLLPCIITLAHLTKRAKRVMSRWKDCVCSPVSGLTLDSAEHCQEVSFSMLFTVNKDSVAGFQVLQKVRAQTASKTKNASRNWNTE